MKVHEIFRSIDGECNFRHQGSLTTFLRLSGCNLECEYCFGILPGRRIPRVITSTGPNKKLHEVKVGDSLMTFSADGQLVETEVIQVHSRTVDRWLRIKINGRLYFVTEEHPFFTTRGLVAANELVVGDMIYHASSRDKNSFSKIGHRNPMKNPLVAAKSKANTDYKALGLAVSRCIALKKEEGTYTPSVLLLDTEKLRQFKLKMSLLRLGSLNPNWKDGGKTPNYDYLKDLVKTSMVKCDLCGSLTNINIHHIDGERDNDDFNNLQVVCHSCHSKIHQVGYNFWSPNRKDGRAINGYEVEAIKIFDRSTYPPSTRPDRLTVYNLTCAPYNTYLLDYMWVHNCDTPTSRSRGVDMVVLDVFKALVNLNCPNLTITGGEPLLQAEEINELLTVWWLHHDRTSVSIETNGTLEPFKYIKPHDRVSFVVDFKLPSAKIGTFHIDFHNVYGKLRGNDWIKFVICDEYDYHSAVQAVREMFPMNKARLAFSPVFGTTAQYTWPKTIAEWMIRDGLWNVNLNVQLHKLIGLP